MELTYPELLDAVTRSQRVSMVRPEVAYESSNQAYNKGWKDVLPWYHEERVAFSDKVKLAKIHAMIACTLRCRKRKFANLWICLDYSTVSVSAGQGGSVKHSPFAKHKVFCRGMYLDCTLSAALLKTSQFITRNCYLNITDGKTFRTQIMITKPICL